MRTRGVPEVDRRYYAQRQKDFVLKDDLLFLNITTSNRTETISVFVVPARKWQAAIDGCHRSARHQGCDWYIKFNEGKVLVAQDVPGTCHGRIQLCR